MCCTARVFNELLSASSIAGGETEKAAPHYRGTRLFCICQQGAVDATAQLDLANEIAVADHIDVATDQADIVQLAVCQRC